MTELLLHNKVVTLSALFGGSVHSTQIQLFESCLFFPRQILRLLNSILVKINFFGIKC